MTNRIRAPYNVISDDIEKGCIGNCVPEVLTKADNRRFNLDRHLIQLLHDMRRRHPDIFRKVGSMIAGNARTPELALVRVIPARPTDIAIRGFTVF